jgi:hypothetical protein
MDYADPLFRIVLDEERYRGDMERLEAVGFEVAGELADMSHAATMRSGARSAFFLSELTARHTLETAERVAHYRLTVSSALLAHGRGTFVWSDDGQLVLVPPLAPSTAAATSTKVTRTEDVMRLIPLDEVSRVRDRLNSVMIADSQWGGGLFLLRAQAGHLDGIEDRERLRVVDDETLERRRVERSIVNALRSIDSYNIQRRLDELRLFRESHTEAELVVFITSDCQSAETVERRLIATDAQWSFGHVQQRHNFHCGFRRIADLAWEALSTAEARRLQAAHDRIARRAVVEHAGTRYRHWRAVAGVQARTRMVMAILVGRCQAAQRSWLVRYFTKWQTFRWQRVTERCDTQWTAAHTAHAARMEADEDETRARMTIESFECKGEWDQLLDAHFDARDVIRAKENAARASLLVQRQDARLLLRRFATWYFFWRHRTSERRAAWIDRKYSALTCRSFFTRWANLVLANVEFRRARRRAVTEESSARDVLSLAAEERHVRFAIDFERIGDLSRVFSRRYDVRDSLRRHLVRVLHERTVRTSRAMLFGRWRRWFDYQCKLTLTLALLTTNTLRRKSWRFNSWVMYHFELSARRFESNELSETFGHLWDRILLENQATLFSAAPMAEEIAARRWITRKFNMTPLAATVRLVRLENRRRERPLTTWKRFVVRRQRIRRLTSIALSERESNHDVHLKWRAARWFSFYVRGADTEKERVRRLRHEHLLAAIEEDRFRRVLDREATFACLATATACVPVGASLRTQRATLSLEQASQFFLVRCRFRNWQQWLERTTWLKQAESKAAVLATTAGVHCLTPYFQCWRSSASRRLHPHYAVELARKNELVLLGKYLRRLTPTRVRLARVSLARKRLLQAQQKAAALTATPADDVIPPSAEDEKRRRPLPPLRNSE